MRSILTVIFLVGFLHSSYALLFGFADVKKCSKKNGNFPKPGSLCRSYYECKTWRPKEVTCPEDQHFFPARGRCVWEEEYPCAEKPTAKECLLPNGKFLKSGTGCKKYYDCNKGVSVEKRCNDDLLFDHVRGKCDWPELVHCPEVVSTTKKSSSPSMSTVRITRRPTTDSEESTSGEGSSSEEDSSEEDDKSTKPNLSTSSSNIDEKVSTDDRFPSSTKETRKSTLSSIGDFSQFPTTGSSIEESSELPTTASGIGDFSPLPTTASNVREFSELPTTESSIRESSQRSTTASNIVESSQLPTTTSSIVESSESPTTTSNIGEFSESQTTSSIVESSQSPTTASSIGEISKSPTSSIVESSQLPTTASSIGEPSESSQTTSKREFSKLPTTASRIEETSQLPTTINIESTAENKTVFDIIASSVTTVNEVISTISERDCNFTNDCIDIKQNTHSTVIDEDYTSTQSDNEDIASASTKSESTDSVTVNIFCPKPSGYFPHPNDKHKFIACVSGDPVIMNCPSNLVYVHKKKTCDYEKI